MEDEHISNSDVDEVDEVDDVNEGNDKVDDDEVDDEVDEVPEEKPHQNGSFLPALNQITTEGVTQAELDDVDMLGVKKHLKQCTFCNKYFKNDMIITDPQNKYKVATDSECFHCLYWMNYQIPVRNQVDGKYGIGIADYIMKCKDVHELDKCTRNSDSGGCFLCEYNLGLPITDIKELYKLNKSSDVPDKPFEEDNLEDDAYKPGKMTVCI